MIPETLHTQPEPVAPESWLIPTLAAEPSGAFVGAHSLVIRGAEPMIVDTGCSLVREEWLDKVWSVLDPADVRWIYLSHDDHDHLGNLFPVLDACPNATLVASFPIVNRLAGDIELPLERMRWLNEGESLTLPDRTLTAVRPPLFDSPSTRALFDESTGVLWGVDSFACFFPGAVYDSREIPQEMFDDSFFAMNVSNTPWLEWVDNEKFAAHVAASAALEPSVLTSAHGPVYRDGAVADVYARTLALAGQAMPPAPDQSVLEMLLALLMADAA
jgi:flavorubredoxin